jgi:protein-S-isoprenylcysteine O-methyltransferase Ste14
MSFLILEKTFLVIGFLLLAYPAVYRITKRLIGLVTSGPYQSVRHLQYQDMILFTLGLEALERLASQQYL